MREYLDVTCINLSSPNACKVCRDWAVKHESDNTYLVAGFNLYNLLLNNCLIIGGEYFAGNRICVSKVLKRNQLGMY